MAETTPVTVLTGFLGAGKTTLLNHLLQDPALARAAVLVNEFGATGIDHLLVRKLDESTVLLNAGCLCCTVRGDLIRALREMLPRARRGEITRILIETTGLANPVPVLAALAGDAVVAAAYHLDGVVTVIDAVQGVHNLDRHNEAVRQVAVADRIVISKSDLADPAPLRARLRRINPGAPMAEVRHGAAAADFVLRAGVSGPAGNAVHDAEEAHDHDPAIAAYGLSLDETLEWPTLAASLDRLLATHGDRVLRIKGILDLVAEDRPVVVHAVGHRLYPLVRLPAWPAGAPRRSQLVIITEDLPRDTVEAVLALPPAGSHNP